MNFQLIWFDSLGAKSSCVLIETDKRILIDPGIAVMHQGFPAPEDKKVEWYKEGRNKIKLAAKRSEIVVISHYHYDHFIDFDKEIYNGKIILTKNPNEFINDSQRRRAVKFFYNFFKAFGGNLKSFLLKPRKKEYKVCDLEIALSKDFGDYQSRREEILKKGIKWFKLRARKWCEERRIPEKKLKDVEIKFSDGESFKFGKTRLKFSKPFFHGVEFSRLGWVVSTVIEYEGKKLIHTSDINGPIIEDYADWLIKENPNFLILDGPMTYMLGYTLNLLTLDGL